MQMVASINGIRSNVSPNAPPNEHPAIGLIGMGEMGRMYAEHLSRAGWKRLYVCDRPERYEQLRDDMAGTLGVVVLPDGHHVARASDFIIYSVEAELIDQVVAQYGPSTKVGSIVAGQTSVKAPERAAFEKYLPNDVHIVSIHSLHGPTVSPLGQPLVIIKHRASDEAKTLIESILRPLGSRFVYLSYEDHDLVTANTQAVTHAAFLSMGTAWAAQKSYPWEHGYYVGGIETVKVNIMHRIYANKWHVYAGLAILNPPACVQIRQYATSTTELFKLMLQRNREALRTRVYSARAKVFGGADCAAERPTILLSEDMLDRFGLGKEPIAGGSSFSSASASASTTVIRTDASSHKDVNAKETTTAVITSGSSDIHTDNTSTAAAPPGSPSEYNNGTPANSHLSLLAMVDCWAALGINPFEHLALAATPIFRLWIGVAEYLFRSRARLDAAINAALLDISHRADDLEFVIAARGWSQCVRFGNFQMYQRRFEQTKEFFKPRFGDSARLGTEMIKAIMDMSASSGNKVARWDVD